MAFGEKVMFQRLDLDDVYTVVFPTVLTIIHFLSYRNLIN
jgi:hypothetical protein